MDTEPLADQPIDDIELPRLFGGLSKWPLVALAVSGGPDSLALLHLVARWLTRVDQKPTVIVMTVDHGLRPTSADEAKSVAQESRALSLPHATLVWEGPKPETGLPEAARAARYGLMCEHLAADALSPRVIVTAHTQDDQAETVLMRLARGSGVDGLAAMRPHVVLRPDAQIALLRPFLGVPKSRLLATLRALGRTWIDDPTNRDLAFERPKLRDAQALRDAAGLTDTALARSALRMARAADALGLATDALEARLVVQVPRLESTIDRVAFQGAPAELRIRLLARLLARHGGEHPRAQLAEIERLDARLADHSSGCTLAGCQIDVSTASITIRREIGRLGLPKLTLMPGQSATWDTRFMVTLAPEAVDACSVRALTALEWAELRRAEPALEPAARWATTAPAFFSGGLLVAVPVHIALACDGRHGICKPLTIGVARASSERLARGLAIGGGDASLEINCGASPIDWRETAPD
jgi:tRNA(Ile)-lysidine synthase